MLRQRINHPLVLNSPEEDLQEISLFEQSSQHQQYKIIANPKTNGFRLDGWFTPSIEHQGLLKSYRSHVISTSHSRDCRKEQQNVKDLSCGEQQRSQQQKRQFVHFRLKRAQPHQYELNYSPLPLSLAKQEKAKQKIHKAVRLSFSNFQLVRSQKNETNQVNLFAKRPIVQMCNYPLLKKLKENNPERKLTANVGRVRRMLKLKLQRKK